MVEPVSSTPAAGAPAAGAPAAGVTKTALDVPNSAAPTVPRVRLTLEVGSYLDEGRARAECDQLAAETGLKAWLVGASEYGGTSYRILLGVYTSQDRADAAANTLLQRGLISEARVVPLPRRSLRR